VVQFAKFGGGKAARRDGTRGEVANVDRPVPKKTMVTTCARYGTALDAYVLH
jgi:hypothetical protein